jgi:hypothetical protein
MSAHRLRIRRIRRAVVGVSIAVFLAAWAIVAVQMIGGRDPALASSTKHRSASAPAARSQADQPAEPAPLTTHQS